MYVRDRMNKNVVSVAENLSIAKALVIMKEAGHRRLPVVDAEKHPVGIIDQRSIEAMGTANFLFSNTKVRDIMNSGFFKINENVIIEECALKIKENKVGFLPVINNENVLCGIITSYDVLKGLMSLMCIHGEGCRAVIKSSDKRGIIDAMGNVEILSIYSDNDTTVVKFNTHDSDTVRYALTEKFEVLYFKEM